MLGSLFRHNRPKGLCGLQFGVGTTRLAYVSALGERISLELCEQLESTDDWSARAELLAQRIKESGLRQARCNLVLETSHYQLFMMEAPKVPAEELRDAVKWKVKDLISQPLDQVTIDVLPLADDCGRAGQKMVYAVVADKNYLEQAIETVKRADLTLESIDIEEMAMRNLSNRLALSNRGVALVSLHEGSGNLALVRQQSLYFTRRFNIDYQGGLLDDIPEQALVLELQRSFDYYERQLGQVPPVNIVLMGEHVTADKLHGQLADAFGAEVSILQPAQWLEDPERFDEQVLNQCIFALGAALRTEEA